MCPNINKGRTPQTNSFMTNVVLPLQIAKQLEQLFHSNIIHFFGFKIFHFYGSKTQHLIITQNENKYIVIYMYKL